MSNVKSAAALPPQEIEHLYAAGWAALQSNRMSEAEEAFLSVLTAEPEHVDALNGLGTVYFHEKRLDEARGLFEKAMHANLGHFYGAQMPDHVDWQAPHDRSLLRSLHGLALTAFREGKTDEAKMRFQEMIDLDPEDHTGAAFMLKDIEQGRERWDQDDES